jgi:hypothetical protein
VGNWNQAIWSFNHSLVFTLNPIKFTSIRLLSSRLPNKLFTGFEAHFISGCQQGAYKDSCHLRCKVMCLVPISRRRKQRVSPKSWNHQKNYGVTLQICRLVICKNILSRNVTLTVFAFSYEGQHPRLNSCHEFGGEEPIVRCDQFNLPQPTETFLFYHHSFWHRSQKSGDFLHVCIISAFTPTWG